MKPSNFKLHPFSSVTRKSETETIALNIIVILSRTGDEWRELPWEEYKKERLADDEKNGSKSFFESEKSHFETALPYTSSEIAARLFSPTWKNAGQ